MSEMNAIERFKLASEGKTTDRVPVEPGIGHYAAMLAKKPLTEVLVNPELMAEVVLGAQARHGYDRVCPITDWGLSTSSMGCVVELKEWEHCKVVEAALKDKSDIAKLKVPNPLTDDRTPVVIEAERIMKERVGDNIRVNGAVAGPLSITSVLRGMEETFFDLSEDPDFIHEVTRIGLEVCKTFGEAQIMNGGVDTIFIYDPTATLLSEPMADEFCFPYLKELITYLNGLGAHVHLHICGDTTRLLEKIVAVGADSIAAHAAVDLREWKEILGDRAVVYGNIDSSKLAMSTSEKIYAEARACLETAAKGGRYVLSSECEVPLETPPENLDAMMKAAIDFSSL